MTGISFHFNVAEPLHYACRLVRKALRQRSRVVVTAEAATLAELDRALWTFEATEFLPHVRLAAGASLAPRVAATPIVLAEDIAAAPHHEVLVNLGAEPPQGFERYERLVEIVSTDEQVRAAARMRWKHYAARGYAIEKHEVNG